MRLICILHLSVLWTASVFAQSIDEEETVHLGVGSSVKEGSADTAFSDDEDFEVLLIKLGIEIFATCIKTT